MTAEILSQAIRLRGLKFYPCLEICYGKLVASYMLAWIEILNLGKSVQFCSVASYMLALIETLLVYCSKRGCDKSGK